MFGLPGEVKMWKAILLGSGAGPGVGLLNPTGVQRLSGPGARMTDG